MRIIVGVPDIDKAAKLTAAAFGFPRPNMVNMFAHGDCCWYGVDEVTGSLLDFLSAITYDDLLYINGTAITPAQHGRGIFGQLLREALSGKSFHYIGLRTQSIYMLRAMAQFCSSTSPAYKALDDPLLTKKAQWLAGAEGDNAQYVIGCYGGPLFREKPVHHDDNVQSWWDSICDFQRGDAVYCVGRLNTTNYRGDA